MFNLKRRLLYLLGDKRNSYDTKLDIITENIYGVDILSGAIEISKLRLWLWLISDYEESKNEIKALPNIEYNLKVGNSLIGWLDEKLVQIPLKTPLTDEVKGILRGLRVAFSGEKKEDVDKAKAYLEGYRLTDYIEAYYLLYKIYRKSHGEEAEDLRKILETIRESIYKSVTPAYLEYINFKIAGIEYGKSHQKQSAKYKALRNKPPITEEDFSKLQVFHWRIDFGHIIQRGGFDVVIENPPYGNLLKDEEKKILSSFITKDASEVAANFFERTIQLTRFGSYIGQIVANSLCINKSTSPCRKIIRESILNCRFALFGTRPAKIFGEAEIRVMIVLGKRAKLDKPSAILTTEAIKLTQESKEYILDKLSFETTEGLELGEKSIGDGYDTSLPKVGSPIIKNILLKLKSKSTLTFQDLIQKKSKYKFELRKTAGYWLNALEKMPYSSTKIEKVYLPNEEYRNFSIILINSSLFYLYWSTYGNLRDFPPQLFFKFPAPNAEFINKHKIEIMRLKEEIEKKLLDSFEAETGRVGEFRTAKCKDTIDKIDYLLSSYYGLSKEELDFIIHYDSHIRPNHSKLVSPIKVIISKEASK